MNHTREGVDSAISLSKCMDANEWEQIESKYKEMILSKGGTKLAELDAYCDALGEKLRSLPEEKLGLTEEELLQVVQWKFAKGKPRHALMKYLKSNGNAKIQLCTTKSFRCAAKGEIQAALTEMCSLSGVGPATASAVLCLYRPDLFSFMDDEVIECFHEAKREYTAKIYLKINNRCQELAQGLGSNWTPYRIGRALWTAARLTAASSPNLVPKAVRSDDFKVDKRPKTNADAKSNSQIAEPVRKRRRRSNKK